MPILHKKIFTFDIERKDFIYNFLPKIDSSEKCQKALFNGISCAIDFLIMELRKDRKIQKLYIDGGLSKSNYLAQTQASVSDICVIQQKDKNKTLLGVVFLMGLYMNIWTKNDIKNFQKIDSKVYFPIFSENDRIKVRNIWASYFEIYNF